MTVDELKKILDRHDGDEEVVISASASEVRQIWHIAAVRVGVLHKGALPIKNREGEYIAYPDHGMGLKVAVIVL